VKNGDLGYLKTVQQHGQDVFTFKDEENNGYTLLHYAVKLNVA